MENSHKTVMAFGVFDIIHDGHRYFLTKARALGTRLVIAVATDASVSKLKKNPPLHSLSERIKNLTAEKIADKVIPGDTASDSWQVIMEQKPDIIAIGYDQKDLGRALQKFITQNNLSIELATILPFVDESLHSSSLRKNL